MGSQGKERIKDNSCGLGLSDWLMVPFTEMESHGEEQVTGWIQSLSLDILNLGFSLSNQVKIPSK